LRAIAAIEFGRQSKPSLIFYTPILKENITS